MVFAVGWQWGPPPRVGMTALPSPPPRQREAFEVVNKWFDAENRADVAAMRAVACADPSPAVLMWIESIGLVGQDEGFVYPDAVIGFHDGGANVRVKTAVRIRPVSESQKQLVEAAQKHGGFFTDELTLADEGGALKVCDIAGAVLK
ncbi:hypothetical protein E2F47_21030 [Mycobacterium eburneum]|nr:hypothetical protein E2F47_21030 [Mycobacterium eburneum]